MARAAVSAAEQDRLIRENQPLVEWIAAGFPHATGANLDDMVADGNVGLLDAVRRFDPDGGSTWRSYAWTRIRGAIVDGLRDRDHLSRDDRRFTSRERRAEDRVSGRAGRTPTSAEIAAELGCTPRQLSDSRQHRSRAELLHLEFVISESDGEPLTAGEVTADPASDQTLRIESEQTRNAVADLLPYLTAEQHLVIGLYFWQECSLREIAEVMSLSVSRVSQIKTNGLARLRDLIKDRRGEF